MYARLCSVLLLVFVVAACSQAVALPLDYEVTVVATNGVPTARLLVTNPGPEAVDLKFRTSQRYDFVVREGAREIWRWSTEMAFLTVITEDRLAPSAQAIYSEMLPALDPGTYTVEAYFLAANGRAPVARTTWTVP